MKKKILIASDAWIPQTNGVVRTLQKTIANAESRGHIVKIIHPGLFKTIPLPSYPEISLAYNFKKEMNQIVNNFDPKYVHIPVELGPIGRHMRSLCIKKEWNFTTAYHTMFPEYCQHRVPFLPIEGLIHKYMKHFHSDSSCIMVATRALMKTLAGRGFKNLALWGRGVDTELFSPARATTDKKEYALYVGRVSVEKNIEDFCKLDLSEYGLKKRVVGDGPLLPSLLAKYPDVEFIGTRTGIELATEYANAAVFVFPSRSDTFGLVLLEALASGVPVAAYNEPNCLSIITFDTGSVLSNLHAAVGYALTKKREYCRNYVLQNYTWERSTDQWLNNLVHI